MKRIISILGFFLLTACAQLGLQAPETFLQRVAVTQASITQVRQSATQLLNMKSISVSDAENVLKQTDAAAEGVAVARQIYTAACPAVPAPAPGASTPAAAPCVVLAADNRLKVATLVLTALQAYLASQAK